MAQLVIAAAGAAIGSATFGAGAVLFGMSGAQLGWIGGSLLASAFAPTQKSQGPRLNDLSVAGSAYGAPLPFVLGTPRVAGQVVWASSKREIATTTSQGKGGGGSEYTSYSYEIDLLLVLTDNPMAGLGRVWQDGKLVANYNASADTGTILASIAPAQWSRLTFYKGDAAQLPDPDYEAAVGTDNAPAYRGRASVFIKSLQLGSGGALPNLTFEVISHGTPLYVAWDHIDHYAPAGFVFSNFGKTALPSIATATPRTRGLLGHGSGQWYFEIFCPMPTGETNWFGVVDAETPITGQPAINYTTGIFAYYRGNGQRGSSSGGFVGSSLGSVPNNATLGFAISLDASTLDMYINGVLTWSHNIGYTGGVDLFPAVAFQSVFYPHTLRTELGEFTYSPPTGFSAWGDTSAELTTATAVSVQTAVNTLLERSGLPAGLLDTTALASITRPVRAMSISQVSSVRTVLEMLQSCYFFDAVLSDKLYFRPRGAAPSGTLAWADIGYAPGVDPMPLRQANELEIPAQMALTYSNIEGDYQTDTQFSDRLHPGQDSASVLTVPLAFTASEAKAIVDAMLMDKAVSALSTTVATGMHLAKYEPTDVLVLTAEDTSTFRMRVTKKTEADGVFTLDCVLDDASVLTQTGVTHGGTSGQTNVATVPNAIFELLDIPLLRDEDDRPGHYLAITSQTVGNQNAAIYASADALTYDYQKTVLDIAALGRCTTTLGPWTGGTVFDETNTVTVDIGASGQLVSVTRSELLNSLSVNAAVIGTQSPPTAGAGALSGLGGVGNCELIQYMTATLVSPGVYTLSGLLRGRRGTEWHNADRTSAINAAAGLYVFVALGNAGLRFMPLMSSDIGKRRWYKVARASAKLSSAPIRHEVIAGNNQLCLSVVDVRANRNATDTVITWKRRTRYNTRIGGTLPEVIPLGEAAELYRVFVFFEAACLNIVERTLTLSVSSPTWTYTAADQIADFGSAQTVLHIKIFQVSAQVGIGDAVVFQGHPAWHV